MSEFLAEPLAALGPPKALDEGAFVAAVLEAAYDPVLELPQLLLGLMQAFAGQLPLAGATLNLHGVGAVELMASARGLRAQWRGAAEGPPPLVAAAAALVLPVRYGQEALGELRLAWLPGAAAREGVLGCCQAFARRCAHFAKRQEARLWAERHLGRPLQLVGCSPALHALECFIEKAAWSCLPVLLRGEFGTEKVQAALALHSGGPWRGGPFVEVCCADPVGEPAQWFEQARGGTLFFNGVDELSPALQAQLPRYLHSRLGQWLREPDAGAVRLVASATSELRQRVEEGSFSRSLAAELDFLCATVPPLRERAADVGPLVLWAMERHGGGPGPDGGGELPALCCGHDWPENLFELERVVARLAVLEGGNAGGLAQPPAAAAANEVLASPQGVPVRVSAAQEAPPVYWARCVMLRDPAPLARLHPALCKALLYLGQHQAEPLSLDLLARQAHVSPSHLGFLFRTELGTSFKPLLTQLRIERAMQLLRDTRQRVSDVALNVGFADLSHFQRSFKRVVGVTARGFRMG